MRVLLPTHQVSGGHEMIAPGTQTGADLTPGCFTKDAPGKRFQTQPERRYAPTPASAQGRAQVGMNGSDVSIPS